jgi:hypothetical protein
VRRTLRADTAQRGCGEPRAQTGAPSNCANNPAIPRFSRVRVNTCYSVTCEALFVLHKPEKLTYVCTHARACDRSAAHRATNGAPASALAQTHVDMPHDFVPSIRCCCVAARARCLARAAFVPDSRVMIVTRRAGVDFHERCWAAAWRAGARTHGAAFITRFFFFSAQCARARDTRAQTWSSLRAAVSARSTWPEAFVCVRRARVISVRAVEMRSIFVAIIVAGAALADAQSCTADVTAMGARRRAQTGGAPRVARFVHSAGSLSHGSCARIILTEAPQEP